MACFIGDEWYEKNDPGTLPKPITPERFLELLKNSSNDYVTLWVPILNKTIKARSLFRTLGKIYLSTGIDDDEWHTPIIDCYEEAPSPYDTLKSIIDRYKNGIGVLDSLKVFLKTHRELLGGNQ